MAVIGWRGLLKQRTVQDMKGKMQQKKAKESLDSRAAVMWSSLVCRGDGGSNP
jgi:hypothetical protein